MKVKDIFSNYKEIEYNILKQLIMFVLNFSSDKDLVLNNDLELNKDEEEKILMHIEDIKSGKPIQYITNKQAFYKDTFFVNENVLIPQPDTEVLVEKAIDILKNMKSDARVLDLCTGSGAIAISIKKEMPNIKMYASDISLKALDVAKKNAKDILNENENAIEFVESNMFENINESFDLIVSNPPYIKHDEISNLEKEVQAEPHIALDGGEDGLDFYRIIKKNENKAKVILFEIGYDQGEDILKIFPDAKIYKDYAGNDRVVEYRKD